MCRYRVVRVDEDAGDSGWLFVPYPDDSEAGEATEYQVALVGRRYADMHPWRCAECNQLAEPEWHRCPMCGGLREDVEA